MAIGKKTRFDVFKRDGFKCKYCGQSPPAVVLEADYLDPKCNGGSDDECNLITSCFACNRGKGGTPLSVMPESVDDQLAQKMELVAQLTAMNEMLRKSHEATQEHIEYIARHWHANAGWLLDGQEKASVRIFLKKLAIDRILEAIDVTVSRKGPSNRTVAKQIAAFKYFCGVCWLMAKEDADG